MIDSIGCAGKAYGKFMIVVSSLVLSRFNLFSSSRPHQILDASVSSLMCVGLVTKSLTVAVACVL